MSKLRFLNHYFYPRSPCGERRCSLRQLQSALRHFYPRSPCGERQKNQYCPPGHRNFYPRSPCGERLLITTTTICIASFLSTLSLRRATPYIYILVNAFLISIHALLAESDARIIDPTFGQEIFLSTLSLRRATKSPANSGPCIRYFYPRSPCGERLLAGYPELFNDLFLSTLSLRRATAQALSVTGSESQFLSTLSLRRAT